MPRHLHPPCVHRRFSTIASTFLLALGATSLVTADLRLDVVASPDPAKPGEILDVELTIMNDGPFDRGDVTVELDWPASTAQLWGPYYDLACPGSYCNEGEIAVHSIASLPAGTGVTISIPMQVSASATDGTEIAVVGRAMDDGAEQASASDVITVDSGREIDLTIAEDRDPVAPGGTLVFDLAWGVRESSAGSPAAELRLPLPAGTTLVSASHGGIAKGGEVVWSLGNAGPGVAGKRRAIVAVAGSVDVGSILRTNAVFDDAAGNTVRAVAQTRVQEEIPLELRVTATPDPVRPGELIDFEIAVTNTGPFDRNDVVIRIEQPDGIARFWGPYWDASCIGNYCDAADRIVFDVGTLPAGASHSISLPLPADTDLEGGRALAIEAHVVDGSGEMRESGATLVVDAARAFAIHLGESIDPVLPGEEVEWTVTFGLRADESGAPGATAHLELPAGVTAIAASDDGEITDGIVSWDLGNLDPGSVGERRVRALVADDLDAGATFEARAWITDAMARPRVSEARTGTRVANVNDRPLSIALVSDADPARPGEALDVEVTVTNTGSFDRNEVRVVMEMPASLDRIWGPYYDAACVGNYCDPSDRIVFDVGTLAPGEGVTRTIPMLVSGSTIRGSVIAFDAWTEDVTGTRSESTTGVTIDANVGAELAVIESDEPMEPGARATWTIAWGVDGDQGGLADAVLELALPEGATFLDATGGGTLDGSIVRWPLGLLQPGTGGLRRVDVLLAKGLADGTILETRARLFDSAGVLAVRAEESTRIEAFPPLDCEVTVRTANAHDPGGDVVVEMTVANLDAFTREEVELVLEFPQGLVRVWGPDIGVACVGNYCDPLDLGTITVGTLAPNEEFVIEIPLVLAGTSADGTVMSFDLHARDVLGFEARDGALLVVADGFDRELEGDIDLDGEVGAEDLLEVLAFWGPCEEPDDCPADINGDGEIGGEDLLIVLANWDG